MSVVVTVFNEEASIPALLDSLLQGSVVPAEVIVVDAGSTDRTRALVESRVSDCAVRNVQLQLVVRAGAGISEGRNIGIAVSCERIIAVTDAGCIVDREWYAKIVRPLHEGRADIVGGFFRADARSVLEKIVAGLTTVPYVPRSFVPSSRSVAFTRDIWEKVGFYPEHLSWGEDTLFAERCIRAGRYEIVHDAVVTWRVRDSLWGVFRQFHQYARGDGEAGSVRPSIIANQLAGWSVAILTLMGWWAAGAFVAVTYSTAIVLRKLKGLGWGLLVPAFGVSALIQIARFSGYLRGFVTGLARRGS